MYSDFALFSCVLEFLVLVKKIFSQLSRLNIYIVIKYVLVHLQYVYMYMRTYTHVHHIY